MRLSAFRDRTANFEKTFAKVWPTPSLTGLPELVGLHPSRGAGDIGVVWVGRRDLAREVKRDSLKTSYNVRPCLNSLNVGE